MAIERDITSERFPSFARELAHVDNLIDGLNWWQRLTLVRALNPNQILQVRRFVSAFGAGMGDVEATYMILMFDAQNGALDAASFTNPAERRKLVPLITLLAGSAHAEKGANIGSDRVSKAVEQAAHICFGG